MPLGDDSLLSRSKAHPASLSLHLLLATHVVVLDVSVALGELGKSVGCMAGKQQIVLWRHGERIPHEREGIDGERARHRTGDSTGGPSVSISRISRISREAIQGTSPPLGVGGASHSSGLFCVSRTAAMGMPKLDAGPQKSAPPKTASSV